MGEGGRKGNSGIPRDSGHPAIADERQVKLPKTGLNDRAWPLTDPMRHVRTEREEAVGQIHRSLTAWRKESTTQRGARPAIPKSGGAALSAPVRQRMESHLGADLGSAKVHTGGESARAAEELGARAFTVGGDVHFGAGEFSPGTKEGDKLLAHELTHVVQGARSGVQRKAEESAGPGHQSQEQMDVSQPGDPAEKEADAIADSVGEKLHGEHGAEKSTVAKEKAPAIGAKLAGAAPISLKKDESQKPSDKAKKEDSSKPQQENKGGQGRGLNVFAVAKSAVEGQVSVNGQELVMEFVARGMDGSAIDLGHGAVKLDEQQQPSDYPHFMIDSTVPRDGKDYAVHIYDQVEMGPSPAPGGKPIPVGKGARTPTTQFAIDKFLAYYQRRFGHDPEKLYGLLAWSNKSNFQREFHKLRSKGMAKDKAAEEAVKKISFGTHRVAVGYDKFEVKLGEDVEVALGIDRETGKDLGKHLVPGRVEVWATRSKK